MCVHVCVLVCLYVFVCLYVCVLLLLLLYSSPDRMYHYRANNVYSLDQSKRKDGIGREAKKEVVFLLAASNLVISLCVQF